MAIGTIYRVAVKTVGSLGADVPYAWNTRHYKTLSGVGTDSTADVLAAFRETVEPAILSSIARKCRVVRYEASLAATPKTITASLDVSEVGEFLRIEYMPSFLCGLVRLHWEVGGDNRKVGKWFAPFIGIINTDAVGSSYTTRLTTLGDALKGDTLPSPQGMIYRPVVWHAASSTADDVFNATASNRYHVYRSRGNTLTDVSMSLFRGLCGFP